MKTILKLLQKQKLNFGEIPENWKSNMNFVQHRPTGRNGWRLNTTHNDNKIFYTYASKIYNDCNFEIRDTFSINKFNELVDRM